jgi:hypothetical protein
MDNVIAVAKSDPHQHSKQYWLAELEKRSAATRRPGQTREQAFSKYCETPDGLALYRAQAATEYEQPAEYMSVQKSVAERAHDTATERLSRLCLAVKAAQPYRDETDIIEEVLKKNPEMAAEMRRENDLQPIEKGARLASDHLIRAAEGLVRRKVEPDQDSAMRRVIATHPTVHAQALSEFDDDEMTGVGKGVRVNKSAAAVDAKGRLTAIAVGLVQNQNYSPDQAWSIVQIRNKELAALMAENEEMPQDLIDLTPDVSDRVPQRGQNQNMNQSGRLNVGKVDWRSGKVTFQKA